MRKATITFVAAAVCLLLGSCRYGTDAAQGDSIRPTDARDGWHLGVMAWTFTRFTFYEAIDKTAARDMHYIQGSPGQVLSNERPGIQFGPDMPAERYAVLDELCKEYNIKVAGRLQADFRGG